MTDKPKVLLFDLGGVIVPSIGMEALADHNNVTRAEISDRFDNNDLYRAYERGLASNKEFIEELPRMFDLPDGNVKDLWNSWVLPPYPGTMEVLAELKPQFTLACLSNTNAIHWDHLNDMFDVDRVFDFAFASHHLQEAKPDRACYEKPLKIMNVSAKDVWFFEDTKPNIDAARAIGIKTFEVDRTIGVIPILRDLGLIN